MEKPRAGLILMRADWLACAEAHVVSDEINGDAANIVSRLERVLDIQGPWVVDSPVALQDCRGCLDEADLDLVVLVFQTWAEDAYLVDLLKSLGDRPLVVWCYLPWRRLPSSATLTESLRGSGPVSAFAAFGALRNLNIPFMLTYGAPDDPRLVQDLKVAGQAAWVRRWLHSTRIGLLPGQDERLLVTLVDEARLSADLGPTIRQIGVSDFRAAVAALPDSDVAAFLAGIRSRWSVRGVAEEDLRQAARAALALARLAQDHQLDLLALDDDSNELQSVFQFRPSLYPPFLQECEIIILPESDLGAAVASLILHAFTGSPVFLMEMWFWDEAKNQIIGGHDGLQDPRMADPGQVWVSSDLHLSAPLSRPGAQVQFVARPGRVTLFQLRATPDGWQAIAASGVCLESQPWIDSFSHAVLRLDAQIDQFLKRIATVGATQHWIMAYGSVLHEIEAFCHMANIPLEIISY